MGENSKVRSWIFSLAALRSAVNGNYLHLVTCSAVNKAEGVNELQDFPQTLLMKTMTKCIFSADFSTEEAGPFVK